MKSLISLWHQVALDMSDLCGTSATLDLKTVQRRVEDEGVSFLTITLPNFNEDLQKALADGWAGRHLFSGFARKGELPRFLGGYLDLIFDRDSGHVLEDPSSDAIYAVRQQTLLFSKISLECSDERKDKAIRGYLQCEKELKEWDSRYAFEENLFGAFSRVSTLLFGDILTAIDHMVYSGDVVPKHGPGATADKLKGNQKFVQTEWPERLEEMFPYLETVLPNYRHHHMVDRVEFLSPQDERPVKVTLVPKTLKTPRIIAIEPTAMQYCQQGLMEKLVELLEADIVLKRKSVVRGMLGFTDQTPNQRLAREGSRDGVLATLDLSEASDRVSNQLVLELTDHYPSFQDAVQSCRSRKADVFGKTIRLSKFASMGSALTFPIEAMVFLTVVFIGIQSQLHAPLTRATIRSFRDQVRVYGDDIIVPAEFALSVTAALETFGFRVNSGKSFWNGRFRESCGKEFYAGNDVSVVKCRRELPTGRTDVEEIVSTVSLRNQLYTTGCWRAARYLDSLLSDILRHFPVVEPESPVLGRHSFLGHEVQKTGVALHNPLVKGYAVQSRIPVNPVDGVDALMKFFLKRGEDPFEDEEHLDRSGRPRVLHIKLGWYSAI